MSRVLSSALALSLMALVGCNRSSPPASTSPPAERTEDSGSPQSQASDAPDDEPSESSPTTQVPQLAGVPQDSAMQFLRLKQLHGVHGRLHLPADQWRNDWAEGRVYLQTPQPATTVLPNANVAFWTLHRAAEDDALVEVPSVIGKSAEAARSELEGAGLAVMTVPRPPAANEKAAPDTVLDQYPRTPQVLGPSSTVLLHVASNPKSN